MVCRDLGVREGGREGGSNGTASEGSDWHPKDTFDLFVVMRIRRERSRKLMMVCGNERMTMI